MLEVAVVDRRRVVAEQLEHVVRVAPTQDRVEEEARAEAVGLAGRGRVGRVVGGRVRGPRVEDDPDLARRAVAPQHLDGEAVREEDVVDRSGAVADVGAAGGVDARDIPEPRRAERLVVGCPVLNAVAEPAGDGLDVGDEGVGRVADRPAAGVLEGLRQVPVVERREGADPGGEQVVDEAVVEVEAGGVDPAAALGQHPWPGDREAERVQPELAHQRDVLGIPVVEVARDRARVAVAHLALAGGEGVPDAHAAPVLLGRALDLVGGGRRPPQEVAGKVSVSGHSASARERGTLTGQVAGS